MKQEEKEVFLYGKENKDWVSKEVAKNLVLRDTLREYIKRREEERREDLLEKNRHAKFLKDVNKKN